MTYAALDKDGKELWAGTFDLDPTASPKVWDHRSHESQKKGGDALGIYELDGDNLKVACVVGTWAGKEWRGKRRPTQLKLPDAEVVIELRRGQPIIPGPACLNERATRGEGSGVRSVIRCFSSVP